MITFQKTNIKNIIEEIDPYISSDYHLLKEIFNDIDIITKPQDLNKFKLEHTKQVVKLHNSIVKKGDVFLFLGDLSESEYDTIVCLKKPLFELFKSLNGTKILIRGNNDTLDESFYKSCGFVEIFSSIESEHYLFTHKPVPISSDKINIHGHIHGNNTYWDMSAENHIDVFWKTNNGPKKLSKYIEEYYKGNHKGKAYLSKTAILQDHILD